MIKPFHIVERRRLTAAFAYTGAFARFQGSTATAAAAWGLLRNALQEFPALAWAGTDMGHAPPPTTTWKQGGGPGTLDAFGGALAGGAWAAPRMLPDQATLTGFLSPENPGEGAVSPSCGAWLVSGGAGGLGRLCAQWATLRGATHLFLVDSRSAGSGRAPGEGAAGPLPAALTAPGCAATVTLAKADVASGEGAAGCRLVRAGGALLQGFLHAAGTLQVKRSFVYNTEESGTIFAF